LPQAGHLLPYIESYTYTSGTLHEKHAKHITRAFPSVMTQIYFEFVGGLSEIEREGDQQIIDKRTYIDCGLGSWMDIFQIESELDSRPVKNFRVALYPQTLYLVFGISPAEVINEEVQLDDLFGSTKAMLLYEELESTTNAAKAVRVFERYFSEALITDLKRKKILSQRLLENDENLQTLSKDIGYSPRWIQKQYREIFGISFKQIHNNRKFVNIISEMNRLLQHRDKPNLSLLAQKNNYFDQAHFIKEFKKNTGTTPGEYLRNRHPDTPNLFW